MAKNQLMSELMKVETEAGYSVTATKPVSSEGKRLCLDSHVTERPFTKRASLPLDEFLAFYTIGFDPII